MKRKVVKLGGSVLVTEQDYLDHAGRIKELSEEIDRVYLVVSAQKGVTNQLVQSMNQDLDDREKAKYLLQGEIASARKIHQYLQSLGVDAGLIMQGSGLFPIEANSSYLNVQLHLDESLDRREILDGLKKKVIVVPGFGAENEKGEPVILGRNSSDFVAGLIARIDSQVEEVVYVKDVPGIYDADGKVISSMSLREALRFGFEQLLDYRVLEYANFDLRIKGIGSEGSLIRC
jgi:aspartokinase